MYNDKATSYKLTYVKGSYASEQYQALGRNTMLD